MFEAIRKPNRQTKVIKLNDRSSEYLGDDLISDKKPVSPLGEVSNAKVGIRTAFGNLRWMFIAPWLIGVCLTLYWHVADFYSSWQSTEETYLSYIEHRKKLYGDDYFDKTSNNVAIRKYNRINKYGEMPLSTYFEIHYKDSVGADRELMADIVLGLLYFVSIPTLTICLLSFRRRAPLYFDRSRRIAYTWRKGRVWAQYYDELWFYQNHQAMTFILYGFDRKDCFKQRNFVVMPTGNPFMNGEVVYRPVLAFVTQFMEKGRDAVLNRDWEGRRGWYLFDDKKPQDFDEQLEAVLQHIKTERVNEEADRLGEEWGFFSKPSA